LGGAAVGANGFHGGRQTRELLVLSIEFFLQRRDLRGGTAVLERRDAVFGLPFDLLDIVRQLGDFLFPSREPLFENAQARRWLQIRNLLLERLEVAVETLKLREITGERLRLTGQAIFQQGDGFV